MSDEFRDSSALIRSRQTERLATLGREQLQWATIQPDPPRGVRLSANTLHWEEPAEARNVTHYNIYVNGDQILDRRIAFGPLRATAVVGMPVFISSYNVHTDLESMRVPAELAAIEGGFMIDSAGNVIMLPNPDGSGGQLIIASPMKLARFGPLPMPPPVAIVSQSGSTFVTSAPHGFITGELVRVSGNSNPSANGNFVVGTIAASQFDITGTLPGTGSGGIAEKLTTAWMRELYVAGTEYNDAPVRIDSAGIRMNAASGTASGLMISSTTGVTPSGAQVFAGNAVNFSAGATDAPPGGPYWWLWADHIQARMRYFAPTGQRGATTVLNPVTSITQVPVTLQYLDWGSTPRSATVLLAVNTNVTSTYVRGGIVTET